MASIEKKARQTKTVYRVRYWNGRRNNVGRRIYDYSPWMDKRKEAEEFRESLIIKKNAKKTDFSHVNQAIDHMLEVSGSIGRNGRKPIQSSTVKYYEDMTNKARSYHWPKPLPELDHKEAKEFRSWLLRTYNRDISRRVLSCVSSSVTEAIGHNRNPFIGITISVEREEISVPSKTDIKAVLQAAERLKNSKNLWIAQTWERYYPIVILLYASGMRTQEFIAFPDLGLLKGNVKVLQALKRTGDIGKPKSKKGLRTIPVDEQFLEPTKWYLKNRWIDNKHRLIFPTESGHPLSRSNFRNKCWIPLMKEASLVTEEVGKTGKPKFVPKFTPHAIRHFFASMQIANDRALKRLSAKRIQDLMGHASIQMTYDVYGHLLDDEDEEVNNAIRNAMRL
ncbi:tyrosine-type recombinase/integrase [Reichenbachiella sp.]|uniref:tyrosine-type recombinase/integrase n=1 Tax=Reichenbachiella sp. TaxID=2184521 RepID=UPI003298D853